MCGESQIRASLPRTWMVWCGVVLGGVVWFGVHQTRLPATDHSSESSSSPTRYGMAEMEQGFCSRLTERGHRAGRLDRCWGGVYRYGVKARAGDHRLLYLLTLRGSREVLPRPIRKKHPGSLESDKRLTRLEQQSLLKGSRRDDYRHPPSSGLDCCITSEQEISTGTRDCL